MTKEFSFSLFPLRPGAHALKILHESDVRCKTIEKRTIEMEKEFHTLVEEYAAAEAQNNRSLMRVLGKRIGINRDLRETLYDLWRRNL